MSRHFCNSMDQFGHGIEEDEVDSSTNDDQNLNPTTGTHMSQEIQSMSDGTSEKKNDHIIETTNTEITESKAQSSLELSEDQNVTKDDTSVDLKPLLLSESLPVKINSLSTSTIKDSRNFKENKSNLEWNDYSTLDPLDFSPYRTISQISNDDVATDTTVSNIDGIKEKTSETATKSSQFIQKTKLNTPSVTKKADSNSAIKRKDSFQRDTFEPRKEEANDMIPADLAIDTKSIQQVKDYANTASGENLDTDEKLSRTNPGSSQFTEKTTKQTSKEAANPASSKGENLDSKTNRNRNNSFQQDPVESVDEVVELEEETTQDDGDNCDNPQSLASPPSPTDNDFSDSKDISNQDSATSHTENGDSRYTLQENCEENEQKRVKITLAVGKSAGEFTVPSQAFMEDLQSKVKDKRIDLVYEELIPQPFNPTKRRQWQENLEIVNYVLLLCLNQSRLGTDIDAVLDKFKGHQKEVILVVFHHVPEKQVSKITSSRDVLGRHAEGKQIVLQVDYAFWKTMGHQCYLNDSALDQLCSHLQNVTD